MSETTTNLPPPDVRSSTSPDNTLVLTVGGQNLTGWTAVRVSRSVEAMPSSFDITATELYPTLANEVFVQPGDPCQIRIGQDLVLTGYVDRYVPVVGPGRHEVRVIGRSKCQDIVDCSAVIHGAQISAASALALAQKLCAPFGVQVKSLAGPGPTIPQFNVNLGETVYEIIERVARYSALLAYDDADGNLVLSRVGSTSMASGFALPGNIEEASASFSMDQRFSEYIAAIMSVDKLSDIGEGGNVQGVAKDPGVPRYRPRIVVSEQFQNGQSLALQRARWEAARRRGRSQAITLTCDAWRDAAGALWAPNSLAPIWASVLKLTSKTWVITSVDFIRDENGTHANITLMPPEALTPEPNPLQLFDWQVGQELQQGAVAPGPPLTGGHA